MECLGICNSTLSTEWPLWGHLQLSPPSGLLRKAYIHIPKHPRAQSPGAGEAPEGLRTPILPATQSSSFHFGTHRQKTLCYCLSVAVTPFCQKKRFLHDFNTVTEPGTSRFHQSYQLLTGEKQSDSRKVSQEMETSVCRPRGGWPRVAIIQNGPAVCSVSPDLNETKFHINWNVGPERNGACHQV